MTIVTRTASRQDLDRVLALWRAADAEPTHTDDLDGLACLVNRDPGALLVAEDATGAIVGSVIAGWDGWRGSVYRLAVHPEHRRKGVGRTLLREAERRIAELGGRRLQATVVEADDRATRFWRASGWEEQVERLRFVKG